MLPKMKVLLSFLISTFLFFTLANSAQAQTITVVSVHPRILITKDNLDILKSRAATTNSSLYGDLKTWCDNKWDDSAGRKALIGGDFKYDAGVLRYALIYLLGEIPGFDYTAHTINEYGDMAARILEEIASDSPHNGASLVYSAIAYDWVNTRLTSAQKTAVVNYFISKCGVTPSFTSTNGYRFPETPWSLYPGLAFYGDGINDSQAQIYVDFISTWLDDIRGVCHQAGEDGGHSSGLAYTKYAYGAGFHLAQDLYALYTATNLTLNDTFDTYTYMNGYPTWLLYGLQPGPVSPNTWYQNDVATVTKTDDSGSWIWNIDSLSDQPLFKALKTMAHVASLKGDNTKAQWITWLITHRFQASEQPSTFNIVLFDKSIAAAAPDTTGMPTCKAFGWNEVDGKIDSFLDNTKAGLGQVYMKSSWDQGANTTHAIFKAFPYYYFGHQHFDSLSFSIFKGEPLALHNSGAYFSHYEGRRIDDPSGFSVGFPHHWYYYERTVSKNSLLVLDPYEVILTDNDYEPYYKDGGQRSIHDNLVASWGGVTEGSSRDWGGLIRHEDTPNYTYSSGDATRGYNSVVEGVEYLTRGASPKVSLVQRDFVYLKSIDGNNDYFVVFDRIDSTDPTFRKVFLLHTVGEPVLNGDTKQIYGGAQGGLHESTNTDSFTMSQTNAKLFMKSLLPSDTKVYKMGGKATATITHDLDDVSGTTFGGSKIDISVSSTAGFTDKPVVTIDGIYSGARSTKEVFMCDGKTSTTLTNCIRGKRYFKYNYPLVISNGASVTQEYTWMVNESGRDWISFPYDFGEVNLLSDVKKDVDEYGRWALWLESQTDKIHTNFLNVLHPTVNLTEQSMAESLLVEAGNMSGALIKDSVNQWAVIFSKTENLQNNLTYQVSYGGNAKHLITGLEYAVYDIYKDGTKILTEQTSKQNTLYFESTGGGNFQIAKTGEAPNNPPIVSVTATPTRGDAPLTVTFSGNGTDNDGSIISYAWNFGDGQTSTAQNPFHTYDTAGNYTATLTVTDNGGATGSANVTINVSETSIMPNSPPAASITANPTSGIPPLTVSFTGSGTDTDGSVVFYSWNFGDGATSAEQNPTHTYNNDGSYTATLTVTDNDGGKAAAAVGIMASGGGGEISNNPPTASVTANPMTGTPPLTINFKGTGTDSDGSIVSYSWNFGDGSTSSQQNPTHSYDASGYYKASLIITDNDGGTASSSVNILVASASGSSTFPYVVNDLNFHPIPDVPRPEKGVKYVDPVFGTEIFRITDAITESGSVAIDYIYAGYPKWDIENADGSKIALSNRYLYNANAPWSKIEDLPRDVRDTKDPDLRWDSENPEILYSTYDSLLLKYNVITKERTVLHDFKEDLPEYPIYRIYTAEEGDPSDDRRYWAFIVKCYDISHDPAWYIPAILVYDKDYFGKDNGKVLAIMRDDDPRWEWIGPNFVSMSPSGNYVHVGAPPSWILDRNLNIVSRIKTHGHVDLAIDDTGREVLVWVGMYYGPTGHENYGYWVKMADIQTGEEFLLAPYGSTGIFHVSGNSHDKPGWALLTNYMPLDYETAEPSEWGHASLLMYELTRKNPLPDWGDHARVWRIAHTHMKRKSGDDDPFGKINLRGTKVWFGSGWGKCFSEGQGPYDIYQINLPPNWYEELMGNKPPVASISANPISGLQPLTVNFTGTGTDTDGTVTSYSWNFGDASTSNEQNPNHTYNNSGQYTVTLAVVDNAGGLGRATISVTVTTPSGGGNDSPIAYLSASPLSGIAPLTINFMGSGTDNNGTIVSYSWNFGDGSTSNEQNPSHTYNAAGTYTAKLTVTDNEGATGSISLEISVASEGMPPAAPTGLQIIGVN